MISVRYYFQGKKLNVSSGVKCRIKDWNDDWEKTIKREPILKSDSDWKEKNLKLKDKESEINNIVLQIEKDGEVPYVDIVKSHLRDNQYLKIKKSLKKIHFLLCLKCLRSGLTLIFTQIELRMLKPSTPH